jgi:hypothetical protein
VIAQVTRNADGSVTAPAIVSLAPGTAPPTAVTYVVEPDGSVDELTAQTPSFLLFPAEAVIASGQTVTVGRGAVSLVELIDSYPATVSAHGGGAATVTAPAGTFSASLFVVDETVQLPGNGGTVPAGRTHTTTTYWLVDGIGIVKIQMTSPQCASCAETLELLHYHVGT